MKKFKIKCVLKLIDFGLFVMDIGDKAEYDLQDFYMVTRLNQLRAEFLERLNEKPR